MKRAETSGKWANFGCIVFLLIYDVLKSTTQTEFWRKMTI